MSDVCLNAVANPVKGRVASLIGFRELGQHNPKRLGKRVNVFFCLEPHVYTSPQLT